MELFRVPVKHRSGKWLIKEVSYVWKPRAIDVLFAAYFVASALLGVAIVTRSGVYFVLSGLGIGAIASCILLVDARGWWTINGTFQIDRANGERASFSVRAWQLIGRFVLMPFPLWFLLYVFDTWHISPMIRPEIERQRQAMEDRRAADLAEIDALFSDESDAHKREMA